MEKIVINVSYGAYDSTTEEAAEIYKKISGKELKRSLVTGEYLAPDRHDPIWANLVEEIPEKVNTDGSKYMVEKFDETKFFAIIHENDGKEDISLIPFVNLNAIKSLSKEELKKYLNDRNIAYVDERDYTALINHSPLAKKTIQENNEWISRCVETRNMEFEEEEKYVNQIKNGQTSNLIMNYPYTMGRISKNFLLATKIAWRCHAPYLKIALTNDPLTEGEAEELKRIINKAFVEGWFLLIFNRGSQAKRNYVLNEIFEHESNRHPNTIVIWAEE